jgi:DNA-binding PadR family transcriptional regulator
VDTVSSKHHPSPLALAVLGLLGVGPLHPYGMQRLMKLWGKDQVINVGQRSNLYKTINRLREDGLVAVLQTERDQQFPERTVYELTDAGRQAVQEWLTGMVSTPRNEFPELPAALSFVMLLGPEQTLAVLERRAALVREAVAALDRELAGHSGTIPRVTLLETEYVRAVTHAELTWIAGVIDDLRTGSLTWSEADFAAAASFVPPD